MKALLSYHSAVGVKFEFMSAQFEIRGVLSKPSRARLAHSSRAAVVPINTCVCVVSNMLDSVSAVSTSDVTKPEVSHGLVSHSASGPRCAGLPSLCS